LLPQLVSKLRGFDLIHLHYPFVFGAEMVSLAAWLHRTPVVVTFHNDLIGEGARANLFTRYQRFAAALIVPSAECICVVSQDHYRSSRLRTQLGKSEPSVMELPNGVDATLFQPGQTTGIRARHSIPYDASAVLFVAALDRAHRFKGLDRLLRAMVILSDAWLLVIGDGELRRAYEEISRDLGVASRTVFAGAIPQLRLPPYYRCADLTVLPSSPPESFGLVLIESLACGTPVVASNIPGVRAVVTNGEDGLLAEPGDVHDLAKKVGRLLDDPKRCREMGRRGRRNVLRCYTWTRIAGLLIQVYEGVLTH
jgi:glycosyltransferase involved in cell wall biosynthesis